VKSSTTREEPSWEGGQDDGDGFLIEFPSPVEAVRCAVVFKKHSEAVHCSFGSASISAISSSRMEMYMRRVNIAARLEQLSDPGVLYFREVYDEVEGKTDFYFESRANSRSRTFPRQCACEPFMPTATAVGQPDQVSAAPDKPTIAVLPSTT
jgi:adenylate cyclase